ncbi:HAD family hydrolase [Methanofollis formosanus]|uniref:HAD family hydrolase n=1 Tax=Methanofollis formosanus TaxID=299308 RepID=A0A8G1A2L2_9EURY|nr:HAD-IC family P-type ATPase [Methanofollis formosanus]QYZ79293.1 HAD family hydrolase [Methanofollis formosanus]
MPGDRTEPLWHALPDEEVLAAIGSSPSGLTAAEAAARLEVYGRNALPTREPPSIFQVFLRQFKSPLIFILIVAGVISLLIGESTDALFIFAVILLNALLGMVQEWKAEQSAAALRALLRIAARVRRDGTETEVPAEEVVPGDIVLLEPGSRVPADLRIFRENVLSIDESLLSGESVPAGKVAGAVDADTPLMGRKNMAYAGSTVISGRGCGMVVATGRQTEVGKIATSISAMEVTKPPLLIRMEQFSRWVGVLVVGASALLAVAALLRGIPAVEVFFMAVALAVSAIPEGLPVAITVALSLGVSRIARRNVVVRNLAAVEGLGSCTCIASDKTGTLTVNEQTLTLIVLPDGGHYTVLGEGYRGEGRVTDAAGLPPEEEEFVRLQEMVRAATLCNEAVLERKDADWAHYGDSIDVAFLACGYKLGLSPETVRGEVALLAEIPFEPERRYAAAFYRVGGSVRVAFKGAPEVVIPRCPWAPAGAAEVAAHLAAAGYRVIGVASGEIRGGVDTPFDEEDIPSLTFLGLACFIDPLRHDAAAAVETSREAGIRVVMVTGDHPATALAIARDLGIASSESALVTGEDLEEAGAPDGDYFRDLVRRGQVFSRVAPLQKSEIVAALQGVGHFVAVTGDGANDAPALRRANIGVAMGSGTDLAKDTASIIITDDAFSSIVTGIEGGRGTYDNIRKVTYLLISTGAAEVLLFTLALLAGLSIPLLAVQLLWLNLVTNGIQDVALAFEAGEPDVMGRRPRPPEEGIFNRQMVEQTLVSGGYIGVTAFLLWAWLLSTGWADDAARNVLLLFMVFMENAHAFNCRSERRSIFRVPLSANPFLVVGVVAAQGVHLLAMQMPVMQTVLGVAPVSLSIWLSLLAVAVSLVLVMEGYKYVRRW